MPYRVGMYDFVRRDAPLHLPTEETSVASMLKAAGYQTMFCGKWHLGNFQKHPDDYPTPSDHGFDYWLANEHNFDMNPKDLWRNGAPAGQLDGIQSTVLVRECIDWLENERDPEKPFCMFLFLNEPHSPVRADEEFKAMYADCDAAARRIEYGGHGVERKNTDPLERPTYFGCVSQMDHEVGRLVAAVDRLGLKEDTFVMFTSDNGPEHRLPTSWGSPGNLRGAKGHMHDGGIHVPGIMRWPGKLKAGTESSLPINGTDLLPTFCAMADADILTEKVVDGVDLLPTLLEDKPVERRVPLFWWLYHARGGKQACVREGDWKMLARMTPQLDPSIHDAEPPKGQTRMEFIKHAGLEDFELYNLRDDPSEKRDVSQKEPDRFDAMRTKMIALHQEIRSEGPVWPSITTGGGGI
jgi:arylsulfatase A